MRRSDKTQNQAEAAQVSEECGTKGQAEGQLCSCVQGCFRDTRKFLLGQEEGDAAAASVTRDVGLLAPSGRQGPDIRGTALWGETQGLRGGGHG